MLEVGDLVLFVNGKNPQLVVSYVKRVTFIVHHIYGGEVKVSKNNVEKWWSLDEKGNYILQDIKDI